MSNINVFKHGENKDVIDGLNNKLIYMLQEDGLICCRNKAKVLVRQEGNDDVLKWKPRVETP
jgi:hypothetical protein